MIGYNTKILVTGCAGFMGSHIMDRLLDLGFNNVYGVDDLSGGFWSNLNKDNIYNFHRRDLSNAYSTAEYIKAIRPEVIYHLAASAREGASQFQPIHILNTNYEAYVNLMVPAIKYGLKKVVMFSSMAVYGGQATPFDETNPRMPEDIYGLNKASMEQTTEIFSKIYGIKYCIIRPHNVFGIRQCLSDKFRNCAAIFMNRIMRDEPLFIYGDGEQTRAFSGVEYSLNCYTNALHLDTNEIINVGGKTPISINRLANEVCDAMGVKFGKYPKHYLADRPLEVKHAYTTCLKSEDLLDYKEPKDGWIKTVHKMASWAKRMGPQNWTTQALELENDKTPKTWLSSFDPKTFKNE